MLISQDVLQVFNIASIEQTVVEERGEMPACLFVVVIDFLLFVLSELTLECISSLLLVNISCDFLNPDTAWLTPRKTFSVNGKRRLIKVILLLMTRDVMTLQQLVCCVVSDKFDNNSFPLECRWRISCVSWSTIEYCVPLLVRNANSMVMRQQQGFEHDEDKEMNARFQNELIRRRYTDDDSAVNTTFCFEDLGFLLDSASCRRLRFHDETNLHKCFSFTDASKEEAGHLISEDKPHWSC